MIIIENGSVPSRGPRPILDSRSAFWLHADRCTCVLLLYRRKVQRWMIDGSRWHIYVRSI